jgi:hypothetical protein
VGSFGRPFPYAGTLYDADHTALAQWLQRNYGIYPAFAGTGYSVKDSYYLSSSQPMTSQQILVKSVSSEYVLKNATLATAGCRCISVPPYAGRANDPLDPDFIAQSGGDGHLQDCGSPDPAAPTCQSDPVSTRLYNSTEYHCASFPMIPASTMAF